MDIQKELDVPAFIADYRGAFGEAAPLPFVLGYSDTPAAATGKIGGCFFKEFHALRDGTIPALSLCLDTIGCGGGKFYTGFTPMPEHVPEFVSRKEKYKKTPEMVLEFIKNLAVPRAAKHYLNFERLDRLTGVSDAEGILILATPDMLAGLAAWAFFDNNAEDAVVACFGSACSTVVTQTVNENRRGGRRTFIGFFDPSARPHVDANVLSFSIPLSRLKEMSRTIQDTCLSGAHAWDKVRDRINQTPD